MIERRARAGTAAPLRRRNATDLPSGDRRDREFVPTNRSVTSPGFEMVSVAWSKSAVYTSIQSVPGAVEERAISSEPNRPDANLARTQELRLALRPPPTTRMDHKPGARIDR